MLALQSTLISIVINGLQQGAIFALLGIGLTIVLGTMNFLNLAHGALYLVGAYIGMLFSVQRTVNSGTLANLGFTTVGLKATPVDLLGTTVNANFLLAMVMVPLVVFGIGLVMERLVARPFYGRPETAQLLVTFGLALVVQEVIRSLMGPTTFQNYQPLAGTVAGTVSLWRVIIIVVSVAIIAGTYLVIERTDFGLVVRAGTEDSEMVRLLGIPITRSYSLIFALGAALAAFAGLIGGSFQTISPPIGTERALVPAFLTIVVGGAGSVVGAIAGGMVLGLVFAGMQQLAPAWSNIVLFGSVAVVILVRPEGLFGRSEVSS